MILLLSILWFGIQNTKENYHGPITYLDGILLGGFQNPDDKSRYTFGDDVDIIGVGSYYKGLVQELNSIVGNISNKYKSYTQKEISH